MPAVVVPKNAIGAGPGYLYWGPIGTALPANTVVASAFTDTWPGAFVPLGITSDGSEFDYTITTAEIIAAEYFDPIQIVTTARAASMKGELMQIHATNMQRVLNGGSLTVSGSGSTQLNTFTPAAVGAEVRSMIGWESQDSTERIVMEQAFQVGSLTIMRKKGNAVAGLAFEFHAEIPASTFPFRYWTAGTIRG